MLQIVLIISDLLFPIWWIGIVVFCIRKKIPLWKAWGIAGTFCLAQAYLVAKIVGWNLGGYLLVFIASLPLFIVGENDQSSELFGILFWVLPPLILVIIPTTVFFTVMKMKRQSVE